VLDNTNVIRSSDALSNLSLGGGLTSNISVAASNVTVSAYTLNVLGDINFTGTLRSNGEIFRSGGGGGGGGAGSSISLAPTFIELLTNANMSPAIGPTNLTYTSSSFTTPTVATSALVSYNGSGWVAGGGLFTATVTLNGVSRTTEVYNPGTTHMPVPALQFMVPLLPSTTYTTSVAFSANALTDVNDFHTLNLTLFPNTAFGSLSATACYALWYANSNVPSGNYVGTTGYGGTVVQNAAGTGINPFSTTTGQFTCQYAGVYQCNFTTNTYLPQDTVQIWKNGALIAPGYQAYGNINNSISVCASIYCDYGDTLGFYVSSGTIQGASSGTQGCSIALVGSATNVTQFTTLGGSNICLLGGSNLAIGKSNAAYALDVAGDVNFSGMLRSNGQAYVGSQWSTSNNYLTYSSNVSIGGSLNFNGSLMSNGVPYVGSQWTTSNNTLTYGSNVYIAGSLTVMGSNIVQNITVQNTLIESSNLVINNAGTGPALSVTQSEVTGQPLAQFIAGSNLGLFIGSNAYVGVGKSNPMYALDVVGSINVSGSVLVNGAALSNSSGGSGSGAAALCQALWYTTSNVPASNYIGTSAYGGTIAQNNSTTSTNPFSTSNGLFTCQYAGVYQCNFTSTTAQAQATVTIYKNGAALAPGYLCYGNFNNSISLSAAVNCSAQDTLGFYVTQGSVQSATQGCSISLMSSGAAATGMGIQNMASFTTSGSFTWTPPSGVTQVTVEVVGGGGGGGGAGATVQAYGGGGGGGAGAYTKAVVNVSSGNTYSIIVGAGGAGGTSTSGGTNTGGTNGSNGSNSSFGLSSSLLISANGGSGGTKPLYNQTNPADSGPNDAWSAGWGGIGGTVASITDTNSVTISILKSAGGSGDDASINTGRNFELGGTGGASYFGSGGRGQNDEIVDLTPGMAIGSGGGGGCAQFPMNGGAGASGAVIITYFTQTGLPVTYAATGPLSMSGTTLSIANATSSSAGVVQPDGTSLVLSGNVLSSGNSKAFFFANNSGTSSGTCQWASPLAASVGYSLTVSNTTVTMTVAGTYFISYCCRIFASGVCSPYAYIYKNGALVTKMDGTNFQSANDVPLCITTCVTLSGTDTLTFTFDTSANGATCTVAAGNATLTILKVL